MTIRRLPLLVGLTMLGVTSLRGQTQPPPPQGQGQTQGQAQGGQGQGGRGQRQAAQPRDRAQAAPQGTGSISGRVLAADTGRPIKRARVIVSGGGRGRTATTDDQGRYQVTELTAGNYNITGSKNGFVDAIYGQRRPLQAGTPVTIADAQAASNVDLRLTRGGVITGTVRDEDGEALARALVTVQRYQYVQGQRQLTSAPADVSW